MLEMQRQTQREKEKMWLDGGSVPRRGRGVRRDNEGVAAHLGDRRGRRGGSSMRTLQAGNYEGTGAR